MFDKNEIQMPPYLNAAYEGDDLFTGDQVRELMKLVSAKERYACMNICLNFADEDSGPDGIELDYHAKLIAARGEA